LPGTLPGIRCLKSLPAVCTNLARQGGVFQQLDDSLCELTRTIRDYQIASRFAIQSLGAKASGNDRRSTRPRLDNFKPGSGANEQRYYCYGCPCYFYHRILWIRDEAHTL